MSNKSIITILTPTYNRKITLPRLYQSLCAQTDQRFCWIVVDDGSQDSTNELFDTWIEEDKINIFYTYKKNGGKHTALNIGFSMLDTELVLIVDSDDYLVSTAIEKVIETWDSIDNKRVSGMVFCKGYSTTQVIGQYYKRDGLIMSLFDCAWNQKNGGEGDKAEVWVSKYLIDKRFPEIEGEKFFSEGYLWAKIAKENDDVYLKNEIIYIAEYLEDGLTSNARRIRVRNPIGSMINANILLTKEFSIKVRVKNAILFDVYKEIIRKKTSDLEKSNNIFLCILLYPISLLLKRYWGKYL